jgi:hypothetical protein
MEKTVSSGEYRLAERRWFDFWNKPYQSDRSFARFLGMTHYTVSPRVNYNILMRPEAVKKIKMLSGPYHHALLVTYKLKKEHKAWTLANTSGKKLASGKST